MCWIGSRLAMIILLVVVAIAAITGEQGAAWAQSRKDGGGDRSDRNDDREIPGICGTPWVNDPTGGVPRYMMRAAKNPFRLELNLRWRGPALLKKVEVDLDGDGLTDIIYFDRDGDGKWDGAWLLNQPEGVYIWDDKNRDEKVQGDEIYILDPSQTC